MQTAFDDWLQQLAAAGKGGASLTDSEVPTATRGLAFTYPIVMAGDWTGGTIAASIRATPDAATALVTLTVSSASYDSVTGYTTWTASLASGTGANSTGALPADTDGDGVETFPISFLFTPSGGTQSLLFGAPFILLGKV
jgi:hypothetical protein